MKMKIVKKSITIPEDLFKFAVKESAVLARERGEQPNLSAYVRKLISKEQQRCAVATGG